MKKTFFLILVLFVALILTVLRKAPEETATAAVSSPTLLKKSSLPLKSSQSLIKEKGIEKESESLHLTELLKDLPKNAQLAGETDESVHFTPRAVSNAAIPLGEVAKRVHDHPEAFREGIAFYENCAANEEIISSVRAVCLRELIDLSDKHLGRNSVSTDKFSPQLVHLASRIPSTP